MSRKRKIPPRTEDWQLSIPELEWRRAHERLEGRDLVMWKRQQYWNYVYIHRHSPEGRHGRFFRNPAGDSDMRRALRRLGDTLPVMSDEELAHYAAPIFAEYARRGPRAGAVVARSVVSDFLFALLVGEIAGEGNWFPDHKLYSECPRGHPYRVMEHEAGGRPLLSPFARLTFEVTSPGAVLTSQVDHVHEEPSGQQSLLVSEPDTYLPLQSVVQCSECGATWPALVTPDESGYPHDWEQNPGLG